MIVVKFLKISGEKSLPDLFRARCKVHVEICQLLEFHQNFFTGATSSDSQEYLTPTKLRPSRKLSSFDDFEILSEGYARWRVNNTPVFPSTNLVHFRKTERLLSHFSQYSYLLTVIIPPQLPSIWTDRTEQRRAGPSWLVNVNFYRYVLYGNCYRKRRIPYLFVTRLDIPLVSRWDIIMLFAKADRCCLCLLFFLLHFFYFCLFIFVQKDAN